jgi:hypothetical protein
MEPKLFQVTHDHVATSLCVKFTNVKDIRSVLAQ